MSRRFNFDKLWVGLHKLNLEQARQLYAELGAIVGALEQQAPPPKPVEKGRKVVEAQHLGDRIYQLERVRCGKVGCKCAGKNGKLHGPYWYAYWRDDGKLRGRYVGKQLRQVD